MSHFRTLHKFKRIATLLVTATMLSACAEVRLTGKTLPQTFVQPSQSEFCVAEPSTLERRTKYLFVIDKSGSNVQSPGPGQPGAGNPPSDPGATKRAGSIERFYDRHGDEPFTDWGMIAFQGGGAGTRALIGQPQNPVFTHNESEVRNGIQKLRSEADAGGTPYADALTLSRLAIQNDLRNHPNEDSFYMVFFLSDGFPAPAVPDQTLRDLVTSIVSLSPGRVILSTGFYKGDGAINIIEATDRLSMMADVGKGKYIDFGSSPDINFDDLIVGGITRDPWTIKYNQLIVYNLNSAICEDGNYDVDSDGDGLCDKDEKTYNLPNGTTVQLDPTKRYSASGSLANYSDYFVWRYARYGEQPPPCTMANGRDDDDHDLLNNCEELYINNPNPQGTLLKNGDKSNPDTDGDGFLDGIETFVFRNTLGSSAMNAYNTLRALDGETESAGIQILQHRNPIKYDPDAFRYDTRIIPTRINESGQQCYSFTQNNLLLHATRAVVATDVAPGFEHGANENQILIQYMQVPQRDPDSKGILTYSIQTLKLRFGPGDAYGSAFGLKMDNNLFRQYIVPK